MIERTFNAERRPSNLKSRRIVTAVTGRTSTRRIRRYVVRVDVTSPDVQAVVANIRSFQNGVLEQLVRNRQVPLVTLRRPEVWIDCVEAGAWIDSDDVGPESRIDRVETAAGRAVGKRYAVAVPTRAGADCGGPRRITRQAQQVL